MRRPSLRPTVADTVSKALIKRLGDAQTGHTWAPSWQSMLRAHFLPLAVGRPLFMWPRGRIYEGLQRGDSFVGPRVEAKKKTLVFHKQSKNR
jgi:hypothetical protein